MAGWLNYAVEALVLGGVTFSRVVLAYCRINQVFESSNSTLAQLTSDPSYLWAEYNLGILRKVFTLAKVFGIKRALLAITRDDVSDRCRHWKGIERRSRRGTYEDRATPDGSYFRTQRFTDDRRLIALILWGPSSLKDAA